MSKAWRQTTRATEACGSEHVHVIKHATANFESRDNQLLCQGCIVCFASAGGAGATTVRMPAPGYGVSIFVH